MKNSFVTVYMPVFNASRFIKLAIDSVLKQSHKNFELLIIDDGSTDGSIEKLSLYEGEECVRIYQQKNIGLNATINRAIDLAKASLSEIGSR